MSKSFQGIIYKRYRIPVNYVIAVETSLVYTNSQFPSFLMNEQDGVIILRCTRLYPAFLRVFLQVILRFLQFYFTYSLYILVIYRLYRV